MPKTNGLTPRQERFIQEYMIDLNATQAAIRAGYSEKTATAMGAENLRKPYIRDAIDKARAELAKRTEISQEWVIEGLVANLQLGAKVGQPGAVNRTYELLGKHVGMFTDKLEIDASDRLSAVLGAIDGRSRPGPRK